MDYYNSNNTGAAKVKLKMKHTTGQTRQDYQEMKEDDTNIENMSDT